MNEQPDISECAAWFRKGIESKLAEAKPHEVSQHDPFDEDNPPNFAREAYEAGCKIGEQMLCEDRGHEYGEARGCCVSDYREHNFYRRNYQECRLCERQKQKTLFATRSADEWREYEEQWGRELTAKRRAEREAKEAKERPSRFPLAALGRLLKGGEGK